MRSVFLLLALSLTFQSFSQTLQPFIETHHGGSVRFLEMEFIGDTLWVAGFQVDNRKGIVWQYNKEGDVIDSVVFDNDHIAKQSFYEISVYGDSVVVIGTQTNGTDQNGELVMHCLDKNLELQWTKAEPYLYDPYVMGLHEFHHLGHRYIAIATIAMQFFKLDFQYNCLDKKRVPTPMSQEPVEFNDSGFVFLGSPKRIYPVDTNFNVLDTIINENVVNSIFGHTLPLPNGDYISTLYRGIGYLDQDYGMMRYYPYFEDYENPMNTRFRSLAPNADTTVIYASGFWNESQDIGHPVHLASYDPNTLWAARLNQDSVEWYQTYYDSIYYYWAINSIVGPDSAFYLMTSRYNATTQPDYADAVIFRIDPQGNLPVGIKPHVRANKQITLYPNPGRSSFHVKLPEHGQARLQLYNMQGKLVKSHLIGQQTEVATHDLTNGIYLYRIVTQNGELYQGKWVKK